jgi:phenylacetate-CoA ligase
LTNFARIIYYLFSGLRRLHWSEDRLRKYQEKKIRSVVRYAYQNVPFYHQKFREAKISPYDIKTLDDLAKLPIVEKDEIRSTPLRSLVSNDFNIKRLKFARTGGSTGKPFYFYISGKEDEWRKAIYLRANVSCGQRPRDRWAFVTSPRHIKDISEFQRKIGIYAQQNISVFSGVKEQIELVRKINPDVLDGYSSATFLLAKEVEREDIGDINPRLIFGSTDLIGLPQIKYVEKIFGAPYYDQYGCAEVNRVAWQCPEKGGYHMDVDSVITQVIDSQGNNVSAGESGKIIFTSLFNYAMPFIRYSVGDVGMLSDEACSCDRIFPLMKVLQGRQDTYIVLPDGSFVSPRALTVCMGLFEHDEDIECFRIVQKKVNLIDIIIKAKNEFIDKKKMEADLVEHFNDILHWDEQNMSYNVNFVDDIPLSEDGKLMAVVSELKPDILF